ncbi:MAG: ABC transporter ATP-binding protein [Lachnospiraceae bacterium]|nr:ABC transporter ATP-binding protein [Lachnospiraceae bacterium]
MSDEKVFLSVKDLVVQYTSAGDIIEAVNGVSFELGKGKTLGLVGETGAGKTTIAKSILRILPDHSAKIVGGEVYFEGQELLSLSEKEMQGIRGNKISMVFQDPMTALNPVKRLGEQISEAIKLHNDVTDEEADKRAKEMLALVGIDESRFREYPHQFSGGMKQRVVIAIALACNPQLLLADEPTTALDVTIQAQVLDMIADLKEKFQTSMIMITHDLGVVAQTCDDVAIIYAGKIVEYGSKEEIFDHPSHPYTIGLFGSLSNMNVDEEWLHPIEGLPPDPANLPKGCAFSPRCEYATEECRCEPIGMAITPDGHQCRCIHIKESLEGRKK